MAGITSQSISKSRSLLPPWLTGLWGFLGVVAILYTLANLAWTYFHWGRPEHVILIANLFSLLPSLLAAAVAWRVVVEKKLSPPVRRAWFILGVSFLMFLIGSVDRSRRGHAPSTRAVVR